MDPNYGEQINPVSRLIQVQQAKGESDPRFMLMRETGQARSKEFIVKVSRRSFFVLFVLDDISFFYVLGYNWRHRMRRKWTK